MTNLTVFRPRSSIILAAISSILLLLFFIQVLFFNPNFSFSSIIFVIFLAALVWLIFIKPKLLVFDEGIKIVNPFTTIVVPLDEIEDISTRYSLTIITRGKRISVWAAPAPGRFHLKSIRADELKGLELESGAYISPGDSPRSHSGAAAQIIKLRIKSMDSQFGLTRASARFNYPTAVILAVGLVAFMILSWLHL